MSPPETVTAEDESRVAARRATLLARYGEMVRHRGFEECISEAVKEKRIDGLLHLSMGAEAVSAGVMSCLLPDDRIYTAHRPHGHFLAGVADERALLAELAGRESGLCRGRGGTVHLMSERVVMATGIVGGALSVAVGHAIRIPPGAVVVVFFGDGAVQTGSFHESLNLVALWNTPVLFVCENNGWAEFSSREEHTTVGNVVRYGDLYGIPAIEVDGTDVEVVTRATTELLAAMRDDRRPALLECHFSRLRPHYEGDWREHEAGRDPLDVLEALLVGLGVGEDELRRSRDGALNHFRTLWNSVLAEEPYPDPADDADLVFARRL